MSNAYEGPPPGHRIKEPYYRAVELVNGLITYTYQLPPPSIHIYDTAVASWASISLPSNIPRLSNMGYTQSKRTLLVTCLVDSQWWSSKMEVPIKVLLASLSRAFGKILYRHTILRAIHSTPLIYLMILALRAVWYCTAWTRLETKEC